MASVCAAGARAWQCIEQVRLERTLRSALHDWLYNSVIWGSTPEDANDKEIVHDFLSNYLSAIRDYTGNNCGNCGSYSLRLTQI